MTAARRFAPQGARLLAETLGHMNFATDGIVIIDWQNKLGLQPKEVAKPVMIVRAAKVVPEFLTNNMVTVEIRLDIEDLFGNDEVTADNLLDAVQQMAKKMEETIQRRKEN
jgi:hypothetical protein